PATDTAAAGTGALLLGDLVDGRLLAGSLAGRRDVLGTGALEDGLCPLRLLRAVGVDGEENATILDASLVTLGLVLGDAHADQGAGQAADRAAHSRPCEGGHDRAGGDERPKPRDRQRADAGEPAEAAADHRSGSGAG